jgi:pilus assembly protein CpaB
MKLRALGLALVFAVLSGALVILYLRKLEVETSGGNKVAVLMAVKPIEPGMTLTEDMLVTRAVPQAYVESRAIREADRARVLGLKVEIPVKPQQTLMWTDLAVTTDDRRYLSDLVQPGMRAVAIHATNDGQHFSLIRPGDRVDVIANLPDPKNENHRIAVLVAQNLLALAVGSEMGGDAARPANASGGDTALTLSATVQQAQQLSLAQERGKVSVVVKPRVDPSSVEGVSDMPYAYLFNGPERPHLAPPSGPAVPRSLSPRDPTGGL